MTITTQSSGGKNLRMKKMYMLKNHLILWFLLFIRKSIKYFKFHAPVKDVC